MMIDMLSGQIMKDMKVALLFEVPIPPEDLLPNMEARERHLMKIGQQVIPVLEIYDNPMYSEQWGEMMAQLRIAQEKAEREWRERNNG